MAKRKELLMNRNLNVDLDPDPGLNRRTGIAIIMFIVILLAAGVLYSC